MGLENQQLHKDVFYKKKEIVEIRKKNDEQ